MINNSSFGFSPFKLNPKLEFYYLSIYSLRPTLLFSVSNRSIGSLACSALGGRLSRALGRGGRSGRGGAAWEQGQNHRGRWRAPCFCRVKRLSEQGACHRPTSKPYPCSPPLPLLHTQAHEKAAMRTAREPMRTAAK